MEKEKKRVEEEESGRVHVWQGYTGKIELVSFRIFQTRPIRRVALGGEHSLFLTYDDALYTCGNNDFSQLGVPALGKDYVFDPCLIESLSGKGIEDISCGANHSACVCDHGNLYCWGDNHRGQCGRVSSPDTDIITSPEVVELAIEAGVCHHGVSCPEEKNRAKQVSCGATHCIALSAEGNVWVWGSGVQLGLGEVQKVSKPTLLKTFLGRKVLKVLSGDFHCLALLERPEVKATDVTPPQAAESRASVDVSIHDSRPSTCSKCNEEIYRYTETSDTCIIHEDHYCKEDPVETEETDTRSADLTGEEQQRERSEVTVETEVKKADDKDAQSAAVRTEEETPLKSDIENKSGNAKETQKPDKESGGKTDIERSETGAEVKSDSVASAETKTDVDAEESVWKKHSPETKGGNSKKDSSSEHVLERSTSSAGSKSLRSASILDQTGAREYLARQFEDEDSPALSEKISSGSQSPQSATEEASSKVPSSPGAFVMQQVSTLGNMTSHVTSMTTKALSSFRSSVADTFKFGSESQDGNVTPTKSSTDTLNTDSSEYLVGAGLSALSLNESDLGDPSFVSESSFSEGTTPTGSPAKRPGSQSASPRSVSKQPQSIRTLEFKQEHLRRRSLSLHVPEVDNTSTETSSPVVAMETEIWSWGVGKKGQLGHGDMLDRLEPMCVQILSDKHIVKFACGSQHSMALTTSGQVFSWGLNTSGQLGHQEVCTTPTKVQMTPDCCVWDIDAGSNHSIFLMDTDSNQGNKPDIFYAGKHPCKDLYVPIYKTPRLTLLKFIRKAGWIRSIASGGDNCACITHPQSDYISTAFQLARFLREWYHQMDKAVQVIIKRIQLSGFYTTLDVFPYKSMLSSSLSAFISLMEKISVGSQEMTQLLRQGESILKASIFTDYESYVGEFKKYSKAFSDMMAVGGFEYCTKTGSSTFDNLESVYGDVLKSFQEGTKCNHAAIFRQIMYMPFGTVNEFSALISRFAEFHTQDSKANNLLTSVHLNWEHVIRTSSMEVTMAENTRAFWDTNGHKLADTLKIPSRRLIRESKTHPLTLSNAGRFSSHSFYLFNDLFIHGQSSSYQSYPLATVWMDAPTSETSSQQNQIVMTTPEDTLTFSVPTSAAKVEWLLAINNAINKVLSTQKQLASRQNSAERLTPPVVRQATHQFVKHNLFREGSYTGYWMNGKVHGSGELQWPDGRKYAGRFKHGAITGRGKMTVPMGDNSAEIQEGQWKDGKQDGAGKIIYANGDLYEGNFKDGLRHGHGMYRRGRHINSASYVYVGEWLSDKKHGYGVMDDVLKGEKYMGMWQEDYRHGDGVVVTLDGMYFEGNFQYNKLVGFGLMLTDDSSCYEGEFAGITLLQGKGTLIFPTGDKIEGTFNGTWNQGLKVSGTFHKNTKLERRSHMSLESQSSLYSKLSVNPDRKWDEIFYHCYSALHYKGTGEPNTKKAWEAIAVTVAQSRRKLKDLARSASASKIRVLLSNLDNLEKIPPQGVETLSIEHYQTIVQYLVRAFGTALHPLGLLIEGLADVFRAAYIGIGAHPRLLYHAVQEVTSFIRRIYRTVRILFPELPKDGKPVQIYPEGTNKTGTPVSEAVGFLQRQVSEIDDDTPTEVVSAIGLLQPILLPKIYPPLFDLYALHCDKEDEKYWERTQKLNKQGDMSLMAYLGIDQAFWCIDDSVFMEQHKRLSTLKDQSYANAVETLQHISTAFCPTDKLEVIQRTFLAISQSVENFCGEGTMLCMDDLFPIFQFVVIRARIHHLGAEINFIEELMESYLEFGELGIMFTTLKACYYQIQNEKMPIH